MKQKLHDFFQMLANKTMPAVPKPTTDKQHASRNTNLFVDMLEDSLTYADRYDVAKIEVKMVGFDSKVMRKRTFIIHD